MRQLGLCVLLLLLAGALSAEPVRYVSDRLSITLRSGQGTQYQILRMLPSGTALEVLEDNPETGYSRVRLPDGTEGWVLSRFLTDQPAARERLAAVQRRLARTAAENKNLRAQIARLSSERDEARRELSRANQENRALKAELEEIRRISADAIALARDNKDLKKRLLNAGRELRLARQENEALKDRTARDWFMVGAGVLLLGILVGLIFPRIRWRRRSSWDSF